MNLYFHLPKLAISLLVVEIMPERQTESRKKWRTLKSEMESGRSKFSRKDLGLHTKHLS